MDSMDKRSRQYRDAKAEHERLSRELSRAPLDPQEQQQRKKEVEQFFKQMRLETKAPRSKRKPKNGKK